MRVIVLEFLDTDIFNLSVQNFVYFLDPLVESWDIDLVTFGMKIFFAPELGGERMRQFEFVERKPEPATHEEPGFRKFLQDASLSGDATQGEIAFLRQLRFKDKRPTALYYYLELQNLRDPSISVPKDRNRGMEPGQTSLSGQSPVKESTTNLLPTPGS